MKQGCGQGLQHQTFEHKINIKMQNARAIPRILKRPRVVQTGKGPRDIVNIHTLGGVQMHDTGVFFPQNFIPNQDIGGKLVGGFLIHAGSHAPR